MAFHLPALPLCLERARETAFRARLPYFPELAVIVRGQLDLGA